MENWGLVTYLMRSLLYNAEESSAGDQQWVAVVVAHELAHQVSACHLVLLSQHEQVNNGQVVIGIRC